MQGTMSGIIYGTLNIYHPVLKGKRDLRGEGIFEGTFGTLNPNRCAFYVDFHAWWYNDW